jgi:hypothetical protein
MDDESWQRARLIPVSGIRGADEEERRGTSAFLAVVDAVKEFGRAMTVPLGAPAGRLATFIEVPFQHGEKKLRPDGLIRVVLGQKCWTALVEVKTGRNVLRAEQLESYLDVARQQKFNAVLTISNQLVTGPGQHPAKVSWPKTNPVALCHLSWSQIRTEALMQQANKSVSDPDQAWILAEFIRYLEHENSGALDFDDMGPHWVEVREGAKNKTLRPQDKSVAEVADRFGQLISFAAMQLSRTLGVVVTPALTSAQQRNPGGALQQAAADLAVTGQVHGALRIPDTVGPVKVTADLSAGRVRCAVTVPAPEKGMPATRVNWLLRQLKDAPGHLHIEATAAWQRGRGPARTLDEVRRDPRLMVQDPKRELRSFTVSMTGNARAARGQGHGSFVKSVLKTIDGFYADVVQYIKPWRAIPPRVKEAEAAPPDDQVQQDITPASVATATVTFDNNGSDPGPAWPD